jgi:hypothetical protein
MTERAQERVSNDRSEGKAATASPTVPRRPRRTAPIDERRPQTIGRPETRRQSAMESRADDEADRPAAW